MMLQGIKKRRKKANKIKKERNEEQEVNVTSKTGDENK